MSLLLGILDHVKQAVTAPFESKSQPQAQAKGVNALDASGTGSTGTTGSSTNQATITANDFLTLLVTEIQNQDPTTQTDPMQYITQLVGVNSLEQLVQINQTLTTATGTATTTGGAVSSPSPAAATSARREDRGDVDLCRVCHCQLIFCRWEVTRSCRHRPIPPWLTRLPRHPPCRPRRSRRVRVPLSPEVMRALQHSIPGATFTGSSSLPAAIQTATGGAVR